MVVFAARKVGQVVSNVGGNGVGQILAAMAAALLLRLFSGPGPALVPQNDEPDGEGENDDVAGDEAPVTGKVSPVTIRWRNITCSLSDKSSKSVSSLFNFFFSFDCYCCLVDEKMEC